MCCRFGVVFCIVRYLKKQIDNNRLYPWSLSLSSCDTVEGTAGKQILPYCMWKCVLVWTRDKDRHRKRMRQREKRTPFHMMWTNPFFVFSCCVSLSSVWIHLLFLFYIVCVTILSVVLCLAGRNVALQGGWLPDYLCEMQCCEHW